MLPLFRLRRLGEDVGALSKYATDLDSFFDFDSIKTLSYAMATNIRCARMREVRAGRLLTSWLGDAAQRPRLVGPWRCSSTSGG